MLSDYWSEWFWGDWPITKRGTQKCQPFHCFPTFSSRGGNLCGGSSQVKWASLWIHGVSSNNSWQINGRKKKKVESALLAVVWVGFSDTELQSRWLHRNLIETFDAKFRRINCPTFTFVEVHPDCQTGAVVDPSVARGRTIDGREWDWSGGENFTF